MTDLDAILQSLWAKPPHVAIAPAIRIEPAEHAVEATPEADEPVELLPAEFYADRGWYWDALSECDARRLRAPLPARCAFCRGIYHHHPMCREMLGEWARMPFGKFKGRRLDELPADYQDWLAKKCNSLTPDLRQQLERVRPDLGVYLIRFDTADDEENPA